MRYVVSRSKVFVALTALSFGTFIALLALVNWYTDPYRLFSSVDPYQDFERRPKPRTHEPLLKAELAARAKPEMLLVGNSRTEIGFDPALIWQSQKIKAFNIGLGGFTIGESVSEIDRILAFGTVKSVVIGVDFWDYANEPHFQRGARHESSAIGKLLPDDASIKTMALLSSSAFMDSFRTWSMKESKYPETLSALGLNPMLDFVGHAKTSGYHEVFETGNLPVRKAFSALQSGARLPPPEKSLALAEVQALIGKLQAQGIEVNLITYPVHASYLGLIEKAGLWRRYKEWHAAVIALAAGYPDKAVRLFDFGCKFNESLERIPRKGDREAIMANYWDSGHFKPVLGAKLLDLVIQERKAGNKDASRAVSSSSQTGEVDDCTALMLAERNAK